MKKNMFKRLAAALLAASMAAAVPMSASAAWVKAGGVWQWTENGTPVTGWRWISGDAAWYHFNASGDMNTGWLQESGEWYYLHPTGAMARFWNQISGKWYFMDTSGVMQYGWVMARELWYFLGPDGAMVTGVIQIDGKTYYFDQNGAMRTGRVVIDGKTYTFDRDGKAVGAAPKAEKAYRTTQKAPVEVAVTTPASRPSAGGGSGTTDPAPVDPTPMEKESTAAFGVVTDNTDLLGKKASEMGTFAVEDTKVTGTAKKVTEYTGWWNDQNEYTGYFIPLVIDPDYVTEGMTIKTANKTFGKADLETEGTYKDSLILVYRLAKGGEELSKDLTVTLNYGEGYTEKAYTLDFSSIYKLAEDAEGDPVAAVGGTAYDSLAAAVDAADGGIVTLIGDMSTTPVLVESNFVLNGDGKTLSPDTTESTNWDNTAMLQISADMEVENLTIDGTVEGDGTNANGIYIQGGSDAASKVTLTNVTIQNCDAQNTEGKSNGAGAAVRSNNVIDLTLEGCKITNNKAENAGGAISFDNTSGTLTLKNCEITKNQGGFYAGGIWVASTAEMFIEGCIITGNTLSEGATTYEGCTCNAGQDLFVNANTYGNGKVTVRDSTIGYIHVEGDGDNYGILTLGGTCTITDVHGYTAKSELIIEEGSDVTIGEKEFKAGTYHWNTSDKAWVLDEPEGGGEGGEIL